MVSKKIVIKNKSGLHARPAGVLAKEAMKCSGNVFMIAGEKTIQLKSILNIMAAGVKSGTEVELQCDGPDEEAELQHLIQIIEDGLGEPVE